MDSGPPYPPKYVMLNDQAGNLRPPPHRRNIPRYQSQNRSSGGKSCLKCICCCYCFLLILILVLLGTAFFLFTVYKPEKPSYNVNQVGVKAFNIQQADFSLYTEFFVSVKADNPNDHIGFIYGKESSVAVLYTGQTLCSGKLPAFHQPANNITVMNILMKGKNEFGSGLQEALLENKKKGKIPLLITVKAPISLVIAGFPLREVVVFVNCSLVVDNLSPNHKIGILSSHYSYDIGF